MINEACDALRNFARDNDISYYAVLRRTDLNNIKSVEDIEAAKDKFNEMIQERKDYKRDLAQRRLELAKKRKIRRIQRRTIVAMIAVSLIVNGIHSLLSLLMLIYTYFMLYMALVAINKGMPGYRTFEQKIYEWWNAYEYEIEDKNDNRYEGDTK